MMVRIGRLLRHQEGYTITELMVVVLLLSLVLGVFYSFIFGGERAARDGRRWLELNQTARLSAERLSRELREADLILSVEPEESGETEITFQSDFNASGSFSGGTYIPHITDDEIVTYRYDAGQKALLVNTKQDPTPEVLAPNLVSFRFLYYGSDPNLDCGLSPPTCSPDGVITWQEIDKSPAFGPQGFGDNDGKLDVELNNVTSIVVEMTVGVANQQHTYRSGIELRNLFK